VLLFGLTGSGKTTQLAELIKYLTKTTGKKALVNSIDRGGIGLLESLAEVEHYQYPSDPFVWIDNVCQGRRLVNGKWVTIDPKAYCLLAMESLTGMGDMVLNALGHQVADGKNLGGAAMSAPKLAIQADGYQINVPSNSPTHYGMAQKHLMEKIWQSQSLGVPVLWTAHEDIAVPAKRDDQGNLRPEVAVALGVQGMIGPLVAGHALTMHLAKYFVYCFRLQQQVTPGGSTHTLYGTRHKDGLYEGIANNRAPLKSTVPAKQQPADLVSYLQLLEKARGE